MIEIVLASNNSDKLKEIRELISGLPIQFIAQGELNVEEAEESGTTFIENAIIKARNACRFTGLPALADDSGLVVHCLDGAPGVYSARYAGENATNEQRIRKLLSEIGDDESVDRSASFHCVLALLEYEEDPAPLICHGIWPGEILHEPRGSNGFGYDPVFYVPTHNCSAAELDPLEKNRISHRGQAFSDFRAIMHQIL